MNGQPIVYETLKRLSIPYEKIDHPPVTTMEEIEKQGLNHMGEIAKNLFLRDAKGKCHYLVTVQGEKRTDLVWLREQLGSTRLSFASEERLQRYLGLKKGAVSPLGILNDRDRQVIVVFDTALKGTLIGLHPNENTASLYLAFDDVEQIVRDHGNQVIFLSFPDAV